MSKKRIANYVFLPGVGSESNAYPNAYSLLQANKTFIKKEANAYIASQIIADTARNIYPNAVALLTNNKTFILDEISAWTAYQASTATVGSIWQGYVYGATEIAKCKRDMGYLIDALIYDIRYGGNERVSFVASQYFLSGVVQVINPAVEVAIQTRLWVLINQYILTKTSYFSQQSPVTSTQVTTGAAAEALAITQSTTLAPIVSNVISSGLSTIPTTVYSAYNFPGYTYDTSKCERDINYVLDAYLNDLRYGGNAKTRTIVSRYWDGEVPQVDGDRKPEIATHTFIRDLINHTIFFGSANTIKCERDIGYMLDGVRYDIALGTNYNQVFLGLAEYNSNDLSSTVISTIQAAGAAVVDLVAVTTNDATAVTRASGFFTEVLDIAQNGTANANTLTVTNPSSATSSQIAVKDKLIANKDFLAAEVNAWVALTYPTADHDTAKCTRDIGYAINAICYDMLYGGNSATYDQAKFFFYAFANNTSGIDPAHTTVTVAAYNRLKSIIDDVVQGQSVSPTTTGTNPNLLTQVTAGNNASPSDALVCQDLVQITTSVINASTYAAATAYLATVTKVYPSVAWATSNLQAAKTAIEANKSSIITSVVDYTPLQNSYPRQLLGGLAAEDTADNRITALAGIITSVIQNGLLSLPPLVNGVTTIKLQGQYNLDKLLLITNATNNQFLYNFSDPALGAIATFDAPHNSNGHDHDDDYPSFLQTTDSVTTLTLKADTSLCSLTDDVQIFVEELEQKTRPYDFGTDAIERMRVAQPQSMLDADFEYGLQPTKWQAIGVARGYPSVYEIPGTDTSVLTVVTDASSGTGGVGESLITVTTQSAHGFTAGTPITIRSLANTISGFSRAEGTFIIISVPTPTTFTYYATAKVGATNGQVLATTYTQLRKGAFYTGAAIGAPVFSVYSNGVVGSFTSKFITTSGTDQIAVAGPLPALGVPISGTGINTGTQISGTVGPGGLAVTATVGDPAVVGDSIITVLDPTGILEGMAIDNGTGTAIFVSGISGNTINFTQPLTTDRAGAIQTYLNKTGTNVAPIGAGATFSVDRAGGVYTNLVVTSTGSNYVIGNQIKILGTDLGGTSPENDLIIQVTDILAGEIVTAAILSGTSVSGERSYSLLSQDSSSGLGSGSQFDISTLNGAYQVAIRVAGINYAFGDTVTFFGSTLGGVNTTNDLVLTVTSASGGTGGIITFDIAGTPGTTDTTFTTLSGNNITTGSGASFNVTRNAGSYTVVTSNLPGLNYHVNDVITIQGTNFSGANGTNDATITVTQVSDLGEINTATITGTAIIGTSIDFYSAVALSDVTIANIPDSTSIATAAIATLQIVFSSAHGLVPGASLLVDITSTGSNHAFAKGPFYVESVPNATTLRYTARTVGVIDTGTTLVGTVYSRPDSYFIHRPFDGGVQLGTGGPQHGVQAIRMSKKYIRYQSGKGIMYTTGALFAPSYNLQSISSTGTTIGSFITVTTDDVDHGCQVGGIVEIIGVDTAGYNGTYTITDVVNERQFKVQAQTTLSNVYGSITTAAQMSILNWHGATVRAGTYDDQNGMFWQYNGQELAVGRRSSTLQLSGVSSVVKDTNLVTGTNTRFRDQVKAGDRIVIKGMTHVVSNVTSQTSMTVTPDYRGAISAVQAKVCLVQDLIVPQSEFNLDRLDGTGPSGYNLDITKMQMIGMQWSWYGAGFIDFMLRGADGNYVFAHRMRNSNINTEAYMRTGNMPVRYEVVNESASGKLKASITATQTTIPLVNATQFPNESGVVYIDNEFISFSGKVGNTLTGCTRSAPMVNFVGGAQRTFRAGSASTHEVNTGVILVSNTISPIISHWGSAFLTDGRFDEDRGYLFNYASTGIQASTTKQTAFLIRLAPSVSNAIIGDLGERELINRAQLLLKAIEVTSDSGTGGLVVEGVLNPQNYPTDPTAITWSGLSGAAAGGQPSFAQVAPGGSVSWSGGASVTTSTATTTTSLSGNTQVPPNVLFSNAAGSNLLYVAKASWDSLGASIGYAVSASDTKYTAGTTITTVTANPDPSASTLAQITGAATIPASAAFKTPANVNYLYILQSNWVALNGATGLSVSSADFPANTTVSGVAGPATANGFSYYTVTFSNNSLVPHNPVVSNLATKQFQVTGNVVTLYFNVTQLIAPYSAGDSITVSGNVGFPAVNGTYSVVSCTTTFVTYNTVTANTVLTTVVGAVVNNASLASTTLSVGGTSTAGATSLLFTQSSWTGLPISVGVVNNTVNDSVKFILGTTISSVSTLKTFNGVNYYSVGFSTSLITSIASGTTITFNYTPYYTIGLSKNSVTQVTYSTSSAATISGTTLTVGGTVTGYFSYGMLVAGSGITANTKITAQLTGTAGGAGTYTIDTSQTVGSAVAITGTPTVAFTPAILSANTSFVYFTQASWETLVAGYGATTGTAVVSATYFPSGTSISSIGQLSNFGGTNYYRVNFTQSSITTVPGGTALSFQFGLPPYALPGETVFSFIAAPGTGSSLDLTELKELTNTTLGGRGTYPNGPDVLAINVYRASGTGSIPTNVIVRWGEAQA